MPVTNLSLVPLTAAPDVARQAVPVAIQVRHGRHDYDGILPGLAAVALAIAGVVAGPVAIAVGALGCMMIAGTRAMLRRLPRDPFTTAFAPEVTPAQISSLDVRQDYATLLAAHEHARRTIARDEAARATVGHLFLQSTELVEEAGGLARGTNNLDYYLDLHPAEAIEWEIRALEQRVAAAADRETSLAYGQALRTRRRQLEVRRQIVELRERVRARLQMATASLEMLAAVGTELGAVRTEAITAKGEALTDGADALATDLEMLETMLACRSPRVADAGTARSDPHAPAL